MKSLATALLVVFGLVLPVQAGNCDIFASNIVVQSSYAPALQATVHVPAVVQSNTYTVATPFVTPVALQYSAPVQTSYNISSIQPTIGVNSLVPTAIRLRTLGGHGFASNVVGSNQVFFDVFGNQFHSSNVRVAVDRFGNQIFVNRRGVRVRAVGAARTLVGAAARTVVGAAARTVFNARVRNNQVLFDRNGNAVVVNRFGNVVRKNVRGGVFVRVR
jgi:hypothetical protein